MIRRFTTVLDLVIYYILYFSADLDLYFYRSSLDYLVLYIYLSLFYAFSVKFHKDKLTGTIYLLPILVSI